jgi:hypothetical protein
MARDKLITIRIEGEKRQAFGDLAKSQNTDTASLLYDFINQCLDGEIDIKLVTGKGNRIDNQLDTNRLDKLETDRQEIDNRLDTIAKKLTDWVEAIDNRLNDCDQGLSEKIFSLEHRLNALAIQLDSQKIDTIEITTQRLDTDSQKDSQRIDDMEYLLKRERECSIANPPDLTSIDGIVETADIEPDSTIEGEDATVKDEDVEPDSTIWRISDALETATGEPIPTGKKGITGSELARRLGINPSGPSRWKSKGIPKEYKDKWELRDNLWYEKD